MDKLVNAISADGDFNGGVITIVGSCVTLAPYIAIGMGAPVPDDVVWFMKMAGFLMLASGTSISIGYMFAVFSKHKISKSSASKAFKEASNKGNAHKHNSDHGQ